MRISRAGRRLALVVAIVASLPPAAPARPFRARLTPFVVELAPIYENHRWSEPHLRWLDPALRLRQGERLRVRCEWFNSTDHVLRYGPSANDEMCNLNGYYFRDEDVPPEERRTIGGYLWPVAP